ncbi:hypothetical protein BB558_007624, partial [Smittium angustum]
IIKENGIKYPPKNNIVIKADIDIIAPYSPKNIKAKEKELYSVNAPLTNSDSDSTKSKGEVRISVLQSSCKDDGFIHFGFESQTSHKKRRGDSLMVKLTAHNRKDISSNLILLNMRISVKGSILDS